MQLTIRGKTWPSTPRVETSDYGLMEQRLETFLRAVPRDAAHAGVSLDKNGQPNAADIRRVIPGMVYLHFPLIESPKERAL